MQPRQSIRLMSAMLLALVSYVGTVRSQTEPLIDIGHEDRTQHAQEIPRSQWLSAPALVVISDGPKLSPPTVSLTLVSLDNTAYQIPSPDVFYYDLRLLNTGNEPISIPSAVDPAQFRSDDPGAISMLITLRLIDDSTGRSSTTSFEDSYGSTSVSGTLVTVPPGSTVRIRLRGFLPLDADVWAGKAVFARASLEMQKVRQPPYARIDSVNSIQIHLAHS
jgi:hypothetical protein